MAQDPLFHQAPIGPKNPKPPVRKRSTTPAPEYGNLIGLFVDTAVASHGHSPPRQIVTRMAAACKKLAAEKVDAEVLQQAVRLMAERGNPPASLPDVVFEVQAKSGPAAQDREAIRLFLEDHDGAWPTGAKFIRGSHAGTYVADPLGYDRLPGGYNAGTSGIHRPTRQEVLDALKGKTTR